MPVAFKIASHSANIIRRTSFINKVHDLLEQTWRGTASGKRSKEILQSSFSAGRGSSVGLQSIQVRSNGLVDTVMSAYNQHHHLVLRSDDVWMAILSQFNFFVNANSETLRSKFVEHQGKKALKVTTVGSRYTANFGAMAKQMSDKIDKNITDKSLKNWILPNFSTTTDNDTIVCAVIMMSTLKSYFSYEFKLIYGLPSVTLQGSKSDWESLVSRLEKLSIFGNEPAAFAMLLRPVLTRFVQAFTNAETNAAQDTDFWGRVCHSVSGGSGPTFFSGWITAFCVWNDKGEWIGPEITVVASEEGLKSISLSPENALNKSGWHCLGPIPELVLDNVPYSIIKTEDIPASYCEVDVHLDDNGLEMDCIMVSGLMGSVVSGEKKDTLQPLPAWVIFVAEPDVWKVDSGIC